jgi:chromosome segregation ATPase
LKAQVAIAETTVGKKEADIQDTKQNLANDKRELEALKERIQELEARLILLKQDLEAFKARLAELRAKLEECKKSSG